MSEISSKNYSWSNLQVVALGRKYQGITGVRYKRNVDLEEVYGAGDEPMDIAEGNKSYEGEITLLQSELEAMQRAGAFDSGANGVDIIHAYVPKDGTPITTDIVVGAKFSGVEKALAQNDKKMEVTLPYKALGIQYGV